MNTLQELVSSLEHKEGIAVSWNDKLSSKDKDGKNIQSDRLQQITFKELYNTINAYSRGFIELGLQKGDSIALISGNNAQWIQLSLGAQNTGIINIPKAEDSKPEDLEYILTHSNPKLVIVEDKKVLNNLNLEKHPEIEHIYSIKDTPGIKNILEIQELGKKSKTELFNVSFDDVAGRIYTSGTTGKPKGVELTHQNLISNMISVRKILTMLDSKDKGMGFLPPWHVFQGAYEILELYMGMELFHSSMSSVPKDFREQNPEEVVIVPRFIEAIYNRVSNAAKEKHVKWLFDFLLPITADYYKRDDGIVKTLEIPFYKVGDKLFFSKVRESLGGNIKCIVCGSSSLPKYLEDFMIASGFDNGKTTFFLEGYGMTEASPVIAARLPGKKMYGTVGVVVDNLEWKIIDPTTNQTLPPGSEGVLKIRGPSVMKGYYNDEEETRKVLSEDGWLNTGDVFRLNKDNTLKFIDRYKNEIKLSSGELINPLPLEETLQESPYINAAVVIGKDSYKYLAVLIHPDYGRVEEYYKSNNMKYDTANPINNLVNPKTGEKVPEIERIIAKDIKDSINKNKKFASHEHIVYFEYIKELRIGEELTATYKIIKRKILEIYHEEVERIDEYMRKKK